MEVNNSFSDASFALARTNVKLTGNIKLTVDSSGDIWFNTIDSNQELSNASYKHCAIVDEWTHPANINKLINGNSSLVNVLYDVKNFVDPTKAVEDLDYSKQYDFSLYFSGAKYLKDVNYTERFSYFAPFHFCNKDIPEYFVILRIDNPINYGLSELSSNPSLYDTEQYMYDIVKSSTIIKTFSLGNDTRVGRYLRKMLGDDNFPSEALSVNFNEGMYTVYSGVHVKNGVYSNASELLYDNFYASDKPIKIFEDYITDGFERNGLLYANIVNFEFLFNDESAELFDHNRYIGLFVNSIEFSKLMVDYRGQKDYQVKFGNEPFIYNNIKRLPTADLFITNDTGCVLSIGSTKTTDGTRDYNKIQFSKDNQIISVLQDKKGSFYRISEVDKDENNNISSVKLVNKEINLKNFLGSDDVIAINDFAEMPENPGKSFVRINFSQLPKEGELLKIYHLGGTHIDEEGYYYDIINFSSGIGEEKLYGDAGEYYYDIVTYDNDTIKHESNWAFRGNVKTQNGVVVNTIDDGDYVILENDINGYNDIDGLYVEEDGELVFYSIYSLKKGDNVAFIDGKRVVNADTSIESNCYYVGITGDYSLIKRFTKALADCVNEMPQRQFTAYSFYDSFIIVYNASGYYNDKMSVTVDIEDKDSFVVYGDEISTNRFQAIGGSDNPNVLLIDYRLADNIDTTCVVRTKLGYSMVKRGDKYAGYFHRNMSEEEIATAFNAIDNYVAVIMEDSIDAALYLKKCNITHEFEIPLGFLSIYNIKDFDFDFYSTRYSNDNSFDWSKYIMNTNSTLSQKYVYKYEGSTMPTLTSDSYINFKNNYFYITDDDVKLANDDVVVTQYCFLNSDDVNMCDIVVEESDIQLGDICFNTEDENVFLVPYNNDESFHFSVSDSGNLNGVNCEYDYNKENYYPTLNATSKTVPYICKWGYNGGVDMKGNPYRLNTSLAFGKNNVSPDMYVNTVNNDAMNLEWLYLLSNAIQDENYCYLNIKNFDVNNIDFDNDLTYTNNGVPSYRYSTISYNKTLKCCETFFRGIKLLFKELVSDRIEFYTEDNIKYKEESKLYDGYRFTAILQPIEEDFSVAQQPIEMTITENSEKKYIVLLVKVVFGSVNGINLGYISENKRFKLSEEEYNITNIQNKLYGEDSEISINGDYRIIFDKETKLSNLTYTDLYSLVSKKFDYEADDYSSVKIPYSFNNGSSSLIALKDFENMIFNLKHVINSTDYFNIITGINNSTNNRVFCHNKTTEKGETVINLNEKVIDVISTNKISMIPTLAFCDLENQESIVYSLSDNHQLFGGKEYYNNLFVELLMFNLKQLINNRNSIVEYNNTNCGMSIDEPTLIKKKDVLKINEIKDNRNNIIGYEYEETNKTQNDVYIYRYSGKYSPIFTNIISMANVDGVGYNTKFNSDLNKFGVIDNFCHMKISDGSIYSYDNNEKYNLEYEYINETPISHKDFNVLHTSWDTNFHLKYTDKNGYEEVPGTLRIEEDDTFINNVIILPDEVNLTKFSVEKVNDAAIIDMIDKEIVYSISNSTIKVRANLVNVMKNKLLQNGISKAFKLLDVDSSRYYEFYGMPLDEYIDEYIEKNILPLYDINKVFVYYEKIQSANSVVISDEDFETKKISNFTVDRNVEINKEDDYVISFNYTIKQGYNSLINLVSVMKLI